ncbi:hypothetical protein ACVWY2_007852 [Bradyrhizobium sp. JR6.1]
MSAACAPVTAPNIIAASKNLRIATLHPTHRMRVDHRLLTLTNRCHRELSTTQVAEARDMTRQRKRRGMIPRRFNR